MALIIANECRKAALDAITALLNTGQFRLTTAANGGGTELALLPLSATAFGAATTASPSVAVSNAITADASVTAGTILGFDLRTSGGVSRINGTVGVGYGKAKEVPAAIAKGVEEAKKSFFKVPRIQGTIPHPVIGEDSAGVVMLRPASPGTGVIAGGAVRAVLECAGIADVLSKSLGSDNPINIVHATVAGLKSLERPEEVAARRGLPLEDVAPAAMLRARAAGES